MVTEYISEAWNAYRKNFWQIIGALALFFVIIFALILASVIPLVAAFAPMLNVMDANVTVQSVSGARSGAVLPAINPFMLVGIGILFFAVVLVIWALAAGLVRVFADALKGKARLEVMFSTARKKFWTVTAANIIVMLLLIPLYILAFVLAGELAAPLFSSLYGLVPATTVFFEYLILFMVPITLVTILFSLTNQAIVIDDCGAVDSVRKSFSVVKQNYLQFLGLVLVLIVITIMVSIVPILGSLINFAVMTPLTALSYTAFYINKSGKGKVSKTARRKTKR